MTEESKVESELENSSKIESGPEETEANMDDGATRLEKPPGGDFLAGLQGFVAWLKELLVRK